MLAGIMRFKENPPKDFFRITTMTSYSNNVELIYLSPKSINIDKETVMGKMLVNDQLVEVEREIPDFIDISPHFFNNQNKKKYKEELKFLDHNCELSITTRTIINKDYLQEVLASKEDFKSLAIPTKEFQNFDELVRHVKDFKKAVIKPIGGLQGNGVIAVELIGSNFILNEQKVKKELSRDEFETYYNEKIKRSKHIVQKFITSVSKEKDPIDCRVHLEKNGKGEWEVARQFIRVGIGQTVVSNINQGGCISEVKQYLQHTFPDNWKQVYENLIKIGRKVPYMLERHNKKEYMTMGLDVGIDTNGDLCLFEVNSFPIVSPQRSRVAKLRGEYYAYRIMQDKNLNYKINKP